jgi:8-amino-7-oxononanoate synthase
MVRDRSPYGWASAALSEMESRHVRRSIRDLELHGVRGVLAGRSVLVFSSNDYLGLSEHPHVVSAMRGASSAGSTGARLLSGSRGELSALEREIAHFLGQEACVVFSSGYLAAVGSIPALALGADLILSDERNHACLIDGVRLARIPKRIYAAGTIPDAVPARDVLLVTESIYGMAGVAAPLDALAERARACGWRTLIDDAHGIGVIGARGEGSGAGFARSTRGAVLGTLSKALGSLGGFVAGPADVIRYLMSAARTFVFDTALPPPVVRAARAALELVPTMAAERRTLVDLGAKLRSRLAAAGVPVSGAPSDAPHLLFITIGDAGASLAFGEALLERGIFAPAIRPPTVPNGASGVRISLTAGHGEDDIDALVAAVEDVHAALLAARH